MFEIHENISSNPVCTTCIQEWVGMVFLEQAAEAGFTWTPGLMQWAVQRWEIWGGVAVVSQQKIIPLFSRTEETGKGVCFPKPYAVSIIILGQHVLP